MKSVLYGSVVTLAAFAASQASATILNFEVTRDNNENVDTNHWNTYYSASPLNAYGDNVDFGAATSGNSPLPDGAGNTYTLNYDRGNGWTPNVVVDYSSAAPNTGDGVGRVADPTVAWGSRVAWLDSDNNYPSNPNHSFYFTFTPDVGYAVRVNSYDLLNYSFGGHSSEITLYKDSVGGTPLVATYADNNVASGPGASQHYDLIAGGSVFYAGTVVLEVKHINGTNWTLALDNLSFEQQLVPEPATLGLFAMGGLALLRRRR
jgi:hypothetical protein